MNARTLLLVDDHATTRKLVRPAFEQAGYLVYEARDGETAIAVMKAKRPDIVLQSLVLPDWDGFQLAKQLRELTVGYRLQLLAFSGLISDGDARRLASADFDDVIAKPIEPGRLIALVEACQARLGATPTREHVGPRDGAQKVASELARDGELLRRSFATSAELAISRALSEAVLTQGDVEGALVAALSSSFDASNCSLCALYLLDRHLHGRMRPLVAKNDQDVEALTSFFGEQEWLRALTQRGEPRALSREGRESCEAGRAVLERARAVSGLVVPLVRAGRPLGALFIAVREGDRHADFGLCRLFALDVAAELTRALSLREAYQASEVAEREAEQQRRLAREREAVLRALVECAPDVIMHLDGSGRVRFINRAPPGLALDRLPQSSWFELMSPECRGDMRAALADVMRDGVTKTLETSTTGPDGGVVWCESHVGPIRSAGEITGAVVIQRDVSLKKHTEAQLIIADRMASVGTLASGLAHEINNPLASVMANVELALHDVQELGTTVSPELLAELRDAREAADRVRRIVRDLKVFARTDDERRGPVDVARVLDSALRLAGNEIRHRARLVRDYHDVPRVEANEARLGQVFLNLIVNAAQAIDEGQAEQNEIRVQLSQPEEGSVTVCIADTGSGMSRAVRARLFTPFFSTKPPGVGTGLGLSICHRIVTAHGGSIEVASDIGRGTEFRVTLPTCLASGARPTHSRRPVHVAARRGRVLVIDDDALMTQALKRTLAAAHEVLALDRAEEALERIALGERFDVIICDVMMPQMSGMDFHRELMRSCPGQAARIVFFTGGAFTPRAKEFLERVPNERLDKPIDGEELKALINARVQ